jgi:hypothetical protein
MTDQPINRRRFLSHTATGLGTLSAGLAVGCDERPEAETPAPKERPPQRSSEPLVRRPYAGPNVVLIRFGGGVRRLETIQSAETTYCPFVYHELFQERGILFKNVEIEARQGIETSHGQGTLYLLTGKYAHYEDITHKPFADRFEAEVPTIFEYFRKAYDVPEHQALIINGEDRINEEFYTFSNHHLFGAHFRSTVLSLYRFKTYLLREELAHGALPEKERLAKEKQLGEMVNKDYRVRDLHDKLQSPELDRFWGNWKDYYGKSGLVNPRGDRVLTALALRALKELRPRLMMVNYQDPDYVHWGNKTFYTRAISIIDEGIRQIYETVQADEEYRHNTVFLVVPDCGRDNARMTSVPFQHHFGTRSSHQIFVIAAGPGIARPSRPVDKLRQQISVAATVGQIMRFPTDHVEEKALQEIFA